MSGERERRTIIFSGQVQGVGFRNRSSHIAKRYPVVGYVRNLPNGTVEIVVEGESSDIAEYMRAVSGAMRGYIENSVSTKQTPTGEFDGFNIVR
jgi:acylphosphatase